MAEVSVKELLEAGVHFGHQTTRWNPKMKPYIFTARNGIHIIDLQQTAEYANQACKFIADKVALGAKVLFVGTKKQAQGVIQENAEKVGMFYVNHRWLGGMLTNFKTIKQSVDRLNELSQKLAAGEFDSFSKKEILQIKRRVEKLEYSLGGIRTMTKLPDVVFVVDPHKEYIAVRESNRLGIPVVALTDTNCNPEGIDYLIPGNDDAIKSISKVVSSIAEACDEGLKCREAVVRKEIAKEEKKEARARVIDTKAEGKGKVKPKAYVSRPEELKKEAQEKEEEEIQNT